MPILFEDFRETLLEKLLIVGGGQKYNQVVILAGGAGSGKGWVLKNVLGGDWKVSDPDELKTALINISKKIEQGDPGLKDMFKRTRSASKVISSLNLRNPEDVTRLHFMVRDLGLDDKQLFTQLAANRTSGNKPNIVIDSTLKNPERGIETINMLKDAGYKPSDIHIVWVLTDYRIAVSQNYRRDRRVFNDILVATHVGAKKTMTELVIKDYGKMAINGDVAVVFGGVAEKVNAKGERISSGGILKMKPGMESEPLYLRLKKAGDPNFNERAVLATLERAEKLAPKTAQVPDDIAAMYPETQPKKPTRIT